MHYDCDCEGVLQSGVKRSRRAGTGAGGSISLAAGALAALALLFVGAELRSQQSPDLIVSLSADDTLPGEVVHDQELVFHAQGQGSHVCWPTETFALLTAETAQLIHPVFTEVDAVHELSGGTTASRRLLFSIGTDEAGFKDGDIIGVGPSGLFEVHTTEAAFIAAAGVTDGNVDIDAYQLDPDGGVCFSFADNEASSFLSGETAGTIKDGDVLYWPPFSAQAQVLYTEAQISAFVTHAIGVTATTTDTTGLARDPLTGDVLFSVQSPTNQDASVFSVANGGMLLPGHAESDLGFTGAPELDAITVAHSRYPSLTTSTPKPAAGSIIELRLSDATPGFPHLVVASLSLSEPSFPLYGWGGLVLPQDALLAASLASAPSLVIVPDGAGNGTFATLLPIGMGALDVVLQVISPGPDLASSNPVLLELAQ